MSQPVCPRCNATLPVGRQPSECPACLLQQAFEFDGESPPQGSQVAPTIASGGPSLIPEISQLANHFPQLEILDVIGRGGMGAVYRARQRALNRIVALKILSQDLADQPGFAERFQREAQTLAQLNHPNIVTVHEAGKNGPHYFLLMEFVEGTDLRTAMRTHALEPFQALEVVQHICSALQYAHEQGVVHRDIKPENILLDKAGKVKIADFGLAKLLKTDNNNQSLTRTHQVMGTLHYMAPEQLEKPLTVDHRADIYSMGVVFYELLTGYLPVGRFKPPSTDSGVDARLDEVVLKSLEREPDERYQSAGEVRQEVQHISSSWNQPPLTLAPEQATPTRPAKPLAAKDTEFDGESRTPSLIAEAVLAYLSPGPLLFGAVMILLGVALLIHTGLDSDVMTWVGLGLTIGGIATLAGSFKSEERPKSIIPNPGMILGGIAFIAIGAIALISEGLNPSLFTWIGIGLILAGGSFLSSGWEDEDKRLPIDRPNVENLLMSLGLLSVGAIMLLFRRDFDVNVMTWIGLGLYLAGASTLTSVWSEEEEESDDHD